MRYLYLSIFLLFSGLILAQTPTDGLMMPQGQFCILGQYSNSKWEDYWQGETKRANLNLGKLSTQSALLMANYGITKNLNAMIGLPYVWTSADVSYITGQKGIQDLSVFVKYQALELAAAGGAFKVQATGGLSRSNSSKQLHPRFTAV